MSYPDVQHLHYNYETLSDLYRPYKLLSNPFNRSMQSLTPSSVGDQREFRRFSNGTIVHMSSHYPLVPDHDSTMYSPATYSASEVELPHHTLYPAPTLVEHQTGPTYNSHHNHHHGGWQSLDSFSVPPDPSLVYGSFPNGTSFPEAPRLTPPPPPTVSAQRLTLSGSLDPTSGIFYRTPEHPRHVSSFSAAENTLPANAASPEGSSASTPRKEGSADPTGSNQNPAFLLLVTLNPAPFRTRDHKSHPKPRREDFILAPFKIFQSPAQPIARREVPFVEAKATEFATSSALMSGADMKNLEEGNLHPNGEAATGSHNMITNPPFHNSYADSTPTINASHLRREGIHPQVMNELYHSTVKVGDLAGDLLGP